MEFRKINYLTLIYHFFSFNYTLGMYNKFNNEKFYRKAKMNIFFPLFTALNNLEGRPLQLKKRPFALFYYSLFCRDNLRETFLPFSFTKKLGLFKILFRYSAKNNFLLKRRIKKSCFYFNLKNYNFLKARNIYLLNKIILIFSFKINFFFKVKNLILNFNVRCKISKKRLKTKKNKNIKLYERSKIIFFYRKKIFNLRGLIKERSNKKIKQKKLNSIYIYSFLKSKYNSDKKQKYDI